MKKFNDFHICLIISAQADIKSLYPKGAIRFEFTRTQSQLIEIESIIEMQSMDRLRSNRYD
ncbi:MAG: AFG1/ZapE family ATPase [Coxiella endosymbiont of Haemaphysalis qinghaiensis]